jgi:hypothetical protein
MRIEYFKGFFFKFVRLLLNFRKTWKRESFSWIYCLLCKHVNCMLFFLYYNGFLSLKKWITFIFIFFISGLAKKSKTMTFWWGNTQSESFHDRLLVAILCIARQISEINPNKSFSNTENLLIEQLRNESTNLLVLRSESSSPPDIHLTWIYIRTGSVKKILNPNLKSKHKIEEALFSVNVVLARCGGSR